MHMMKRILTQDKTENDTGRNAIAQERTPHALTVLTVFVKSDTGKNGVSYIIFLYSILKKQEQREYYLLRERGE